MSNIETKVIAAMGGSGLGAALSAFLLWVFGVFMFGASWHADQVATALAAVPEPVGALLAILVAIGGAFVGGYSAPHTNRPDLVALLTPTLGTLTEGGVFLGPGQAVASTEIPQPPTGTPPAV